MLHRFSGVFLPSLPTPLFAPLACAFSHQEINRIVHAIRFFDEEMAKESEIFDFTKHSKDLFLVAGAHTTQKHIDWMKAGESEIKRYNLPLNPNTIACLRQKAKYLLLYSFQTDKEDTALHVYSVKYAENWDKEQIIASGYPYPHHEKYAVLFLTKEYEIPEVQISILRESKRIVAGNHYRNSAFVIKGEDIQTSLSAKKFTFIDLFAGAGGLSEGFVRVGFKPIAHIEMNNYACDTLRTRAAFHYLDEHNQLDIYEEYLRTKKEKENGEALWKQVPQRVIDSVIEATIGANTIDGIFKRVDELTNGEHVDLIIGGPPCQAYSIAGRARMGDKVLDDPRNELYKYYVEFLKRYTPEMFVFENVPGIQTAKKGEPFKDLRRVVDEAGYEMDFRVQLASDHGVLQNRRRMIIVGWKKGSNLRYPELQPELSNYTIRRDILADLPERKAGEGHLCAPIEYTKPANEMPYLVEKGLRGKMPFTTQHIARPNNLNDREIYKMAVEWWKRGKRLKYTDIPADHQKHKNKQTFLNRFQVVDPNGCCHTLVAHIAMDGHYYIYPTENPTVDNVRSITIREAARIQSFPDDYFFEGSRSAAFKQIGNAVPVLLAEKIANEVNILLSEYHEH